MLDEDQHQQAAGKVEKVRNSRQAATDAVRVLMKMSTQLSRCCWVRKTNLRATEQLEKFHVRRGIHRSSASQIIHKNLRFKCCKKRRAQQVTEANCMHVLFSACSLRDDNVITSKPTWKPKQSNFILDLLTSCAKCHQNRSLSFWGIPFQSWCIFETQCNISYMNDVTTGFNVDWKAGSVPIRRNTIRRILKKCIVWVNAVVLWKKIVLCNSKPSQHS